jgi:methanogenic corrinoid protein MtbC1
MSDAVPFRLPPVDPSTADAVPAASLTPELLAGLLADGDDELAAWAMRHAMAESSRTEVYDSLLREAMVLVGERWATGRWSVAEEHLASRTLLRALERLRPELGPEARVGPLAVLAGVAGEHHMIGLACLEQILAEDGWTVANLGADVPAADLSTFVRRSETALVCLSALDSARTTAVADAVRAVRAARPGIPVVVGGQITDVPGVAAAVGADAAARTLAEAAAVARERRPADPPGA